VFRFSSFPFLQGQDVYSISVLSGEGNSPQCASELAFLSFLEVANPSKNQMCLDAQLNCQNCIDLKTKSIDAIPPCIVDINIEKEYSKKPESTDEAVESLKGEGVLTVSFLYSSSYSIAFRLSKTAYVK
jgi:hypothetical protein